VRIAVSGTHGTGKSSLVEALGGHLPQHTTVPEPYEVLEERGYVFTHPPSVEDFVVQLKQSLITLRRRSPNVIFDRCPLDFVGYIAAGPEAERFDLDAWRTPILQAMKSLDLVVALHADARHDPAIPVDDAAVRRAVDEELRNIVDGDCFDLCDGIEILVLDGPWDRRVETVLAHIDRLRPQRMASPRP
jgi:energy-coupling factor transporter ATP-binding protein EcfA2